MKVFALFNFLVFIAALVATAGCYSLAKRYFVNDIYFIAPLLNESRLHFSQSDIEPLRFSFPDYTIVPASRGNILVSTPVQQEPATVIYTEGYYFEMYFMNFLEGSHWHSHGDLNNIVINEALAWRLFGGVDVIGLEVGINGISHVIIGVVRQGKARADSLNTAWMPLRTATEGLPVTTLYIQAHEYNSLNAELDTQKMLRDHIRKNPGEYAIVDINRYVKNIGIPGQNTPLPPEGYLSYGMRRLSQLNRYGNYALITGAVGLFNLLFLIIVWRRK
ncbi:MAG: ABC transporter permease [Defluviitaleaceae bacterium]|nr:ABC transporter permease [Defluviitaleaceae bacterium]